MMEIGVIVVMAVLLFPAKELPKLVRTIARIYGQVRKTAEDFRKTVLEDEDLREPIDQIRGAYNDARWEVRDAERKARQQLAKAQMEMRMATARRIEADKDTNKAKVAAQEDREETEPADAHGPASAVGAPSADSAKVALDASTAGEPSRGPVAGSDPRKIAASRPPTYTPPDETPVSSPVAASGPNDGARDDVA